MARNYKGYQLIKRGKSFQIRINNKGQTYFYTYHPSEKLTPSKQYAEAEKEAIRLRDRIRSGYAGTIPLFKDYAEYILETKKSLLIKRSTQNGYKYILRRIIDEFGDVPMDTITPERINRFFVKLKKDTANIPSSAYAIEGKLKDYIATKTITIKKLSEMASICNNTASLAVNGKTVSMNTAQSICDALGIDLNDFFMCIDNKRTLANKTIIEHRRLLNSILNQAVTEKIIETNPMVATVAPKKKKSKPNYYQPDEVSAIWQSINEEPLRWKVIISLLIVTGCRRAEIAGLRWDNILWDHRIIRINTQSLYNEDDGAYIEESTKADDDKYVQFDEYTFTLLRQYYDEFRANMQALGLKEKEYPKFCFFQTKNPDKPILPSTINSHLRSFSKKHGFRNINPHSLRHSLASALIFEGVDVSAIQRQLGHKQESTTRGIYVHEIQEYQAKVAAKIPTIFKHEKDESDG
ncbi:MAG: hypothetical protein E7222_13045 [Clostridiales bacterium]|nr:hypothetical protein [Clostridiales bacterium]